MCGARIAAWCDLDLRHSDTLCRRWLHNPYRSDGKWHSNQVQVVAASRFHLEAPHRLMHCVENIRSACSLQATSISTALMVARIRRWKHRRVYPIALKKAEYAASRKEDYRALGQLKTRSTVDHMCLSPELVERGIRVEAGKHRY